MNMHLDRVVPLGRSRREYELMFQLTDRDLAKRILGCADGPASFNAEMTADGHRVISFDPIYEFEAAEIRQRFDETIEDLIDQVKATPDNWVWSYHRGADDLRHNRHCAIETFLADYDTGRDARRYRVAALPELPFADGEFGLALCSHLLFLYSEILDAEFHVQSAIEMCRVADEVRIFPLVTLTHSKSPHLETVRTKLESLGISSRVEAVEYELQKGGNQMLRLYRE